MKNKKQIHLIVSWIILIILAGFLAMIAKEASDKSAMEFVAGFPAVLFAGFGAMFMVAGAVWVCFPDINELFLKIRIWFLQETLDKLYRTRCYYNLMDYYTFEKNPLTKQINTNYIDAHMVQYDIDVAEKKLNILLAKLKFITDNSGR